MTCVSRTMLAAALLAACSLATTVRAQAPSVKRDSAVAKLTTGQQIRISAEGMERLIGRAGVATGDTLDFAQDDMVRRIPISAIDTLWIRGRATSSGALIGGIAGLAVGLLGGAYAVASCEGDCSGSEGGAVVGFAAVGTIVGVGVGALIGSAFPKWKRKFP